MMPIRRGTGADAVPPEWRAAIRQPDMPTLRAAFVVEAEETFRHAVIVDEFVPASELEPFTLPEIAVAAGLVAASCLRRQSVATLGRSLRAAEPALMAAFVDGARQYLQRTWRTDDPDFGDAEQLVDQLDGTVDERAELAAAAIAALWRSANGGRELLW